MVSIQFQKPLLKNSIMKNLITILLISCTLSAFAQKDSRTGNETEVDYKWRISMPYLIPEELIDGWNKRTSTQMVE